MVEMTFFLGLQVRQLEDDIFINQAKYNRELLKKFDMESCSTASTLMNSFSKLDKDKNGQSVDINVYRGIIGSLLYLIVSRPNILFIVGVCRIFQANTKQSQLRSRCPLPRQEQKLNILSRAAVVQLLWVQQQMRDFGIEVDESPIFYDNNSAITITYNPVLYYPTKHIDIKHHFI
ncbi:uncharacterized protein LOC124923855 [Impatiens glandulifera]|uniref:uncharacterized protein LOC124923855 n=1 Tax=Impatiens glandulifera TaxID=253017 RepID=UPI001FB06A3E|nr:uncharacterized protein LOC124923855 [Impatiens glandulifera]